MDLACAGASASIQPLGGELVAWQEAGSPPLLWHGDAAHWPHHAPILFPIVGHAANDVIHHDGIAYPTQRHGFTRTSLFTVASTAPDRVELVLRDTEEIKAIFPFAFVLRLAYRLGAAGLRLDLSLANPGTVPLPYATGFHPAFRWPFAGASQSGYRVVFEREEASSLIGGGPDGLIEREMRLSPLSGRTLSLTPERFEQGAIIFRDAKSRRLTFAAPDGSAIEMATDGFPHLALWTKTTAPFLCLEAWTGYSDPRGFTGNLTEKPSMRLLPPGQEATYGVDLTYRPPGSVL
ncbi:MAG: aldose 1-epimerase family protein [Proteobacteria bacterium]|nr:aldose 1-epimerase family protein [Pseudomonadota bacterium]